MNARSFPPLRQGLSVRTGKVRLSYLKLREPDPMSGAYGATILVPATDEATLTALRDAVMEAGRGKWGAKWDAMVTSKSVKLPFRSGDAELAAGKKEGPEWIGQIFFSARNKRAVPAVVDLNKRPLDIGAVGSGDYAVVSLYTNAYDTSGAGVGFILDAIQLVEKGESLGGSGDPTGLFEEHGTPTGPATGSAPGSMAGLL